MNGIAHAFISYFVLSFFVPGVNEYLLPIFIFSFIPDLDHIIGFIRMGVFYESHGKKIFIRDHAKLFRTIIQEPIGIIMIEIILAALFIFGVRSIVLYIAAACIALHWIVDFLTVHTMPFAPISNKEVCFFFKKETQWMKRELVITAIAFVLSIIRFYVLNAAI